MYLAIKALFGNRCKIVCLIIVFLDGCGTTIPLPVPVPATGDLYASESKLEVLMDDSASRHDVIQSLGYPDRQNNRNASYKTCIKHPGVNWIGEENSLYTDRRTKECYELVLEFDANDLLTSYNKTVFKGFTTKGKLSVERMRSLAEKGVPEAQWKLYNNYGRDPSNLVWLCRSADNGYEKAQLRVGYIYSSNTDTDDNKLKAYVWFRKAMSYNILRLSLENQRAAHNYSTIKRKLTPEEINEATHLYTEWKPGQCEKEICSRKISGASCLLE